VRARLHGLRRDERGYTLLELLMVMVILGIVMGGISQIFVSGGTAEVELNRRFQAQEQARLALDKVRGDIHLACSALASSGTSNTINTYPALRLNVTSPCLTGTASYIYWCVISVSTSPVEYQLWRTTSGAAPTTTTCTSSDTSRTLVADYLITNTAFTTATIPQHGLQTVGVDFKVDVNPTSTSKDVFELTDSIVARNSSRCGTVGGCAVPTSIP